MLTIGKKAPDFVLPDAEGKLVRLKDFAGKKIVLYFYPKDNTSGCTREACSFQEEIKIFQKKNAIVLGVSADSQESHKKFAQKLHLHFSLLSDIEKKAIKDYDVWKEKSMYGKKYFGIERTTIVIDEQGIVRMIFRKVKVDGHTDEVLKVL